jgi:hypothetical protein
MLEGVLRGKSGFFPAGCVQEVRLRNPDALKAAGVPGRVAGRREEREQQQELLHDHLQLMQSGTGSQRLFSTATRGKTRM